jgi:hypothetical protein
VILQFGKYRGQDIRRVPSSYLIWILEEVARLSPAQKTALKSEIGARLGLTPSSPSRSRALPTGLRPTVERILVTGYRQEAHRVHPDHGGTNDAMRDVIAAKAWLAANVLVEAG